MLHRVGVQLAHQPRGVREQCIARQNGHRVGPPKVRGIHAAAAVRLIHDIVVVERGHVDHFHHGGRLNHLGRLRAFTKLGSQQRHHRAETLAPGQGEVAHLVFNEVLPAVELRIQQVLYSSHPGVDTLGELRIPQVHVLGVSLAV